MIKRLRISEARRAYQDRTGKRMTQRELAKRLWPDEKQSTREVKLSAYENGKAKRVDIETALKIADLLDVDLNFLFGIDLSLEQLSDKIGVNYFELCDMIAKKTKP